MSWFESVSFKTPVSDSAKPLDAAAMVQLGAMSPLWMMFLGASTAGMAYWSMTRWMRLATPERFAQNVVKLRLVKPEPAPAPELKVAEPEPLPVAELKAVAPEPAPIEPVIVEIASVSVVMPEPVAEIAVAAAPELVKLAPAPKPVAVAKPAPVKVAAPKPVVVAKPAAKPPAAKKPAAKKVVAKKVIAKPVAKAVPAAAPVKAVAKAAPVKAAAPKPTAKRTVKAKPKA